MQAAELTNAGEELREDEGDVPPNGGKGGVSVCKRGDDILPQPGNTQTTGFARDKLSCPNLLTDETRTISEMKVNARMGPARLQ